MCCDSELESSFMCGDSTLPVCGQHMWTCAVVINAGSAQVVEANTNRARIKLYHKR